MLITSLGSHVSDPAGYQASCRRARALGFEGKWAIHPSQIALANEAFTPSSNQVEWAAKIIAQLEVAAATGQGAIGVDNVLIDRAHLKLAQKLRRRSELIGMRVPDMK